jgi:Kef-type K+ transport system membrane component KefB/mannitol/fructose-specific phosphotransferase system IIA component (Ntr-type)
VHQDVSVFLISLAVLLCAAKLLGEGARRLKLPAVVGEIVAGVLVGKTLLGRLAPAAYASLFPDGPPRTLLTGYTTVAVMLLLVVAGLEIDLTVVRKSGRIVVLTSLLGLVLPFLLGWGMGRLLPDGDLADPSRRGLHAAFLGIALAISALPVIAKTLLDLGLMKTDLGLIILSSAVFNDVVGWIGFSVLSREFTAGSASTLSRVLVATLLTALFVAVALLIVRPITDRLLGRIQAPGDVASGRVLSLIMVLALVGGAVTQTLGVHAVFGAFIMGIAVGDSRRLREHTRQTLHDFVTNVFTPVFFATMALRVDFAAAFDLRLVVLVVTVSCAAKIGGCAVGARIAGVAWREAFAIGFGMNSRGAMEVLLAMLALEAGIINEKIFVALVVMAVVTSTLSGPAMMRLLKPAPSPIAARLRAGAVVLDSPIASREELIVSLTAATAVRLGRVVDAGRMAQKVLEREALAGTGVGEGVAFPHAEVEGLTEPALGFARLLNGVDFDAPDGQPVRLVFLLLTPPRDYDRELQILSAMARLLTREDVRKGLLGGLDTDAILETIEQADRAPASVAMASTRRARAAT